MCIIPVVNYSNVAGFALFLIAYKNDNNWSCSFVGETSPGDKADYNFLLNLQPKTLEQRCYIVMVVVV